MDFPAALSLVGLDPFISDDDAHDLRQMLDRDEKTIASIDEEIAAVKAALASLTQKRNFAMHHVAMASNPSDDEVKAIRNNIQEEQARLQAVEEEIRTTRLQLESQQTDESLGADSESQFAGSDSYRITIQRLENERAELIAKIARYEALISPIRILPLEIMAYIFFLCLPDTTFVRPSPTDAPILLTRVCRGWRDIVLPTPRLWSSIGIVLREDGCEPPLSVIRNWVTLSKNQPLSFSIDERVHVEDIRANMDLKTSAAVMEEFLPAYSRWKRVSMSHADWRVGDLGIFRIPVTNDPPPLLEELYMNREYWTDVVDVLKLLVAAPRLRSMHWRGILSGVGSITEVLPIETLMEVKLDVPLTKDTFFSVLAAGCNLTKADLVVAFVGSIVEEDFTPYVLSNLQHLILVVDKAQDILFNSFTTPSLRHLHVKRIDGPPSIVRLDGEGRFWSQVAFTEMMKRSGASLDSLEIVDTDMAPYELSETLHLLSDSLESLSVTNDHSNHNCVDDGVISSLLFPTSFEKPLCPRLRYLKLWRTVAAKDGLLSSLIESRWYKEETESAVLDMAMIKFSEDTKHKADIQRLKRLNEKRRGITWIHS